MIWSFPSSFSTYLARMSHSRFSAVARAGALRRFVLWYVCGMIGRGHHVPIERRDREADAVDGHRALEDQVAVQFGRRPYRQPPVPVPQRSRARATRPCRPRAPARCGRPAGPWATAARSRFTGAPRPQVAEVAAAQRLGRDVGARTIRLASSTAVRQTPLTADAGALDDVVASTVRQRMRRRAPAARGSSASTTPTSSMIPVNMAQPPLPARPRRRTRPRVIWCSVTSRKTMASDAPRAARLPPTTGSDCSPPRILGA